MATARSGSDVKVAFGLAIFLTITAALIDDGTVAWLLFPFILGLIVVCVARAPLRNSLLTLAFCALTLDCPTEPLAFGYWHSPFFSVGFALLNHLNNLTGIRSLSFSGTDIILLVMGVTAIVRERSATSIDRVGRIPTPRAMVKLAQLSLAATGFIWLFGMLRGGDFGKSLWQAERVVYLPVLFLLYHLGLRGPKDHLLLGKVLIAAAIVRASLAIYISRFFVPPIDPSSGKPAVLAYMTSHSDSMLFAAAFVLLILLVVERVGGKARKVAFSLLPILLIGMIANNRRLVWVHVAMILLTLYVVAPDNAIKRRIRRTLTQVVPLILLYVIVGWNRGSKLFKPVQIMRSVVDPGTDGSSLWRELENYNLVFTLREYPLFGQGYGHRWIERVKLPAVNYDLEYFLPHNSLLGLWACGGFVGYTAITLLWGAGVFFGMRAYHAAKAPTDRVTGILCVGAVMVYLVQAFGDLGLGSWTGVHILAPSLAVAGKLAVATGAWGVEGRAVAAVSPPAPPPATGRPFGNRP